MSLKIKSIGSLGVLLAMSCGPSDPKVQEQSSTKINGRVPRTSFLLNLKTEKRFDGSFTVWKEGADHSKIAEVMKLSIQSKVERNAANQYGGRIEDLENDLTKKKDKISELENKEELKFAHFYQDQSPQLTKDSAAWVKTQINTGKETDFELFCDVGLLYFSVSKFLTRNEFSSKPQGLAICSDYYNTKGLFQSAACSNVNNYVQCIWEDGIFKTFTLYTRDGKTKIDPNDYAHAFQLISKTLTESDFDADTTKKVGNISNYKLKLEKPGVGSKRFNMIFSTSNAKQIFSNENLPSFIDAISKDRTTNGQYFSFNDRLFNFHLLTKEAPMLGPLQTEFEELRTKSPELFGGVPQADEGVQNTIKTLVAQRDAIQLEINKLTKEQNTHIKNYNDKCDAPASELLRNFNLASFLLAGIELNLKPVNNLVMVQLKINSGDTLKGCYEKGTGASKPCEGGGDTLHVSYNEHDNLLNLVAQISDVDKAGFTKLKKVEGGTDFQLLGSDELLGRTLHLKMYQRMYGPFLDSVTGDIHIKDNGVIKHQGSINLTGKASRKEMLLLLNDPV